MFSDKQLKDMILPLLMEQFLLMLVGLADTIIPFLLWEYIMRERRYTEVSEKQV